MKRILTTTVLLLVTSSVLAEGPYAGMQDRTVKALSEQQVADLSQGRGMGMALAAELNGYPGPSHVLELAEKLELRPEQISAIRSLFESMKRESIPLGARLIEEETELDGQFATQAITPDSLRTAPNGHCRRCPHARRTPGNSSQVSPVHGRAAGSGANEPVCKPERISGAGPSSASPINGRMLVTRADVDDVGPDSAGACGEAAHGDASVNAAPTPFPYEDAGGARRGRDCVRVPGPHAGDHAHAVRTDAAKDRNPSAIQPAPTEASAVRQEEESRPPRR